ncbi:hypothetical protein RUM43_014006 [Polyplax serrata]|uniref:Chromatin accessibility complex protein 1 n=1 Tax=Polyplax serrata TaxID=468196 RepID=A0AAN8S2Q1_POLSC
MLTREKKYENKINLPRKLQDTSERIRIDYGKGMLSADGEITKAKIKLAALTLSFKKMAASSSKHFQLPISRVKTIMKSSPDVENVSSESIHLVAKATELFIQYLAQESLINSKSAAELRYEDLAEIVDKDQRLEFLRELIPQKITVREYRSLLGRQNFRKVYGTEFDSC